MKTSVQLLIVTLLVVFGCSKDDGPAPPVAMNRPDPVTQAEPTEEEVKSSEKQILSFRFTGIESEGLTVEITAEINEEGKGITIEMPASTDITDLEPSLEISEKATYEPAGSQDFSAPINYTVTAEDGTSRTYLVTVDVALSQKEILLRISEVNPGNELDWSESDSISDWNQVELDENGRVVILNLSRMSLSVLPPEIGLLTDLQDLHVSENNISQIPPEIGELQNLKVFNLNLNNIDELPAEFWDLSELISLNLSSNDLQVLSPELGKLQNLVSLNLRSNKISLIPPEVAELSSLTALDLGSNQLSEIPKELNRLPVLEALSLANNDIGDLLPVFRDPSGLSTSCSSNLKTLFLFGNEKLRTLPACICEMDPIYGGTTVIDIVEDNENSWATCDDGNILGK